MDTLAHARELADEILEMTKSLGITGEKENENAELEAYYTHLEDREPLVEELLDLKLQIDDTEAASPEFEAIKKVIEQITEMDKKHLAFVQKIHKTVQASYKEVKLGQRINKGYSSFSGDETASQFDINT
ncbi:MAG: hypothetical protein FWB80_11265 [Defluviitaleaceae bacterium]|nr:hypothetical protein [Defluviitaleaceae bacterium]